MNQTLVSKVRERFRQRFSGTPRIFYSPGRVNIIGEHTDYNEGFVLPAAIDKTICIGVSLRDDDRIELRSEDFNDEHSTRLDEVRPTGKGWPDYILGVVDQLRKRGYALKGFNLNIDGDVPIGSGLSSSAAVECATAFALNELNGLGIDRLQLALIAQKAEHEFAGVMCGIMDQFASVFGKQGHVIRLDCRSLEYEYVPLRLGDYRILLLNTNVKHSLASSEYNTRRRQCEAGVELVRKAYPEVRSLRDASIELLDRYVKDVDELVYRRCRFVVEENERLLAACELLKAGDLEGLGQKMYGSHEGLSRDYEVSCRELDFLVDAVRSRPEVLGARMMGGGFGGCTINLVKQEAIAPLVDEISRQYKQAMGLDLEAYAAQTENGSGAVF